MSPANPNRFLQAHDRPRVAVFTSARFPAEHEQALLQRLLQLADEEQLDLRFFHSSVSDDLPATPALEELLQRSMLAPCNTPWNEADMAWFEAQHPEAVQTIFSTIAAHAGISVEEARAHPPIAAAFTMARLARAWDADLAISHGHFESGAAASICRALLGIGRAHVVRNLPSDALLARLWPWNAAQSQLLMFGPDAAPLAARSGELAPDAATCDLDHENVRRELRALLRDKRGEGRADRRPAGFGGESPKEPTSCGVARPFVVIGAERTGSNMLVGMLESHPEITSYGELFNRRLIGEDVLDGVPEDYDTEHLLALRQRDQAAFYEELVRLAAERGARSVGFKLLYYHACVHGGLVEHLTSISNLHVIHLRRRDRLGRWVSHKRAAESDSWFTNQSTPRSERPTQTARLGVGETLGDFLQQAQQEERADATFGHLPLMQVYYEDLTERPGDVTADVLAFLGAAPHDLQIRSRKTGRSDPRELIENWHELGPALRRTPWRALAEPR